MSDLEKLELKSFYQKKDFKHSSNDGNLTDSFNIQKIIEIVIVTICLTNDHDQCNGKYVDSQGKFLIKCHCDCHLKPNHYSRLTTKGQKSLTNKNGY